MITWLKCNHSFLASDVNTVQVLWKFILDFKSELDRRVEFFGNVPYTIFGIWMDWLVCRRLTHWKCISVLTWWYQYRWIKLISKYLPCMLYQHGIYVSYRLPSLLNFAYIIKLRSIDSIDISTDLDVLTNKTTYYRFMYANATIKERIHKYCIGKSNQSR